MKQMIGNGSFWMGALGCLVCFGFLQLVTNQPWARGQSALAEGGAKSLTGSAGGATYGKMDGPTSVPRLIPFQAYLTDSNGRPVEGQHSLTFRIYDDPTQGTMQWSETHPSVPVSKGMVNVLLGKVASLDSQTFESPRYVGITVDGGLELVPRQQLIPSFWARNADAATEAAHAGDALKLVKPGTLDPAVTVDSVGNVGVGVAAPGAKLHVADDGTSPAHIWIDGGDSTNPELYFRLPRQYSVIQSGKDLRFRIYDGAGWPDRLTIAQSGNVGIGIASPTAKLDVENGYARIHKYGGVFPNDGQWHDLENSDTVDAMTAMYILHINSQLDGANSATCIVLLSTSYYGATATKLHQVQSGPSFVVTL